jgi:hypothetical protein
MNHADDSLHVGSEQMTEVQLALSRTLATHVERYEGEVLPAIQRALFHS